MQMWCEVLCGAEVDDAGLVSQLSAEQLALKREQLTQIGGPPRAWLDLLDRRQKTAERASLP
jgi:hypothetical protein